MEQPDFDEEFESAIAEWCERHRLREDDAVLLLVELFRIHQRHWDEVRRHEMPSFEQFRVDIARLAEAAKVFQQETTALLAGLQNHPAPHQGQGLSLAAAVLSAFGSLLAGYLIAKAWP